MPSRGGDDWAGEYGQKFSWSAFVAKEIVAQVGNTLLNTGKDTLMPWRRVERGMDDYLADRARGESELDAALIAIAKNVPIMSAGWGLGEAWEGRTRGGVDHRRRLNTGERVGRLGGFIAVEAGGLAVALKITGNNPTLFGTRGASAPSFANRARAQGLTENPHRPGSFGKYDQGGTFHEVVRIDPATAARGEHTHLLGGKEHLPPDTPIPGE